MSADVARLAGVMVSEAAAAELVGALEQLDRLAAPRGMRLSNRLNEIRRELAACASRAGARGAANQSGIGGEGVAEFELSVVDTTSAAAELGLTRSGVTWLCRNGHLRATRAAGRWWIETTSLQHYRDRKE